ncbi:phage antirepressor KilAC domain-containing protein [Trueperella pecoris]|uniref:Phage antirepressor KilAC domain-containing protein n=1 Tax=Trueperella pecoris TaxID=2733571 RepID=A0A7M1R020_9ACTO|nr:phage antirepressor KilAC domain-containing protein [Trueperella pecoris]QOR47609.1 phage antirepressor KilAC domain-containing protein [Trueperella pecoris]
MSSSIIPFRFDDTTVRTIAKADGETWFVLADALTALGIKRKPSAVVERLDDDVRQTYPIRDSLGREQHAHIVNEAGLYDVIMRSDAPAAKPFRRWVTHEVLPAIRTKGGYLTPEATEQALTDPDFIIRLATSLKEERAHRTKLEAQAAKDAPKVLFADSVASSHTTILVGELAKILRGNGVKIGGTRLFAWMRENGYLIARRGSDWNRPTQRAMELGLFEIKETAINHSDGHVSTNFTPKVTGKGQQYFVAKFLNANKEDVA